MTSQGKVFFVTEIYESCSSDDADHRRKRVESAEEGECNDDGVELRPSLRFAVLDFQGLTFDLQNKKSALSGA